MLQRKLWMCGFLSETSESWFFRRWSSGSRLSGRRLSSSRLAGCRLAGSWTRGNGFLCRWSRRLENRTGRFNSRRRSTSADTNQKWKLWTVF